MRQRRQPSQEQVPPYIPSLQNNTVDPSVLINMKKEMEEKKSKVKTLEGRRDALYDQLDSEFGCKSIEDADTKIKELDIELNKKKEQRQSGIQTLLAKYQWDFNK